MEDAHEPESPTSAEADNVVAAIDLGSNSFHMVVARLSGGQLQIIDKLKEPVRLAAGLDSLSDLSTEAQDRALDCLRRFGERVRHMPAGAVRAVGTNTLRQARNGPAFLAAAAGALRHDIEVVSGIEEARLIYLGVSHSLSEDRGRRLVLDIGGGSTELIVGEGFEPRSMESLYIGCVSMTNDFFAGGKITAKRFRRAVLAARQELEPHEGRFSAGNWDDAIGSSGTIAAVQRLVRGGEAEDSSITAAGLAQLRDQLITAGHTTALTFPDVNPDRIPVLPGGLAVLLATFDALQIERMRVSDGALREGVLYDLLGRFRDEDVRARSVAFLRSRYHVDEEQASRVEKTALYCLLHVASAWELDDDEAENLLSWAAQLHEIGLAMAHSHYHKHGAYIALNSDLPGFSQQVQEQVALLIRAHRRKFPVEEFATLTPPVARRLQRLAILLRLGVVLHRSRSVQPLPPFSLLVGKASLHLSFPSGWLKAHPLTQADLEQEAAYLDAAGMALRIE